ncbi:MAG TPA: pyridoxamine 5'-phosphate oxidase [Thermoanaerobaculia bacterium]|nr:pyridoxamine 5'-phosphate oxidase [Thermoanaerobaculia bacterium]
MDVSDLRREYVAGGLSEADLVQNPILQFKGWLGQALEIDLKDATAMTLATADAAGRPTARIVLLKGCDERGFVFFTNYESRKGRELAANPRAALVFFWAALDRQVRIEGTVERTSREESAAYFATRPLGARLGAWASRQSRVLAGREELEREFAAQEARFARGEVPLPDFWGGFRLRPEAIEFWQGRASRLHDRFRYERSGDGAWRVERLAP